MSKLNYNRTQFVEYREKNKPIHRDYLATECHQEWSERTCPHCQIKLVIRHGQYGDFLGCLGFPKCRYTERLNTH